MLEKYPYSEIGQVEPTPEPAPDNPEQPDNDENSDNNEDSSHYTTLHSFSLTLHGFT